MALVVYIALPRKSPINRLRQVLNDAGAVNRKPERPDRVCLFQKKRMGWIPACPVPVAVYARHRDRAAIAAVADRGEQSLRK